MNRKWRIISRCEWCSSGFATEHDVLMPSSALDQHIVRMSAGKCFSSVNTHHVLTGIAFEMIEPVVVGEVVETRVLTEKLRALTSEVIP